MAGYLRKIGAVLVSIFVGLFFQGCGGLLTGRVMGTENTLIVLSVGRADKVQEGDIFWVWRKETELNGGTATVRVGKIRVVDVLGEHSALGEVFYGKAEAGDQVQRVRGEKP